MAEPIRRTDLFATPIWTVDLLDFRPELPRMIETAQRVLDEAPAPGELFTQSRAVLQDDPDPSWVRFFRVLAGYMESIVGRDLPLQYPFEQAFLRSWVLRIDGTEDFGTTGGVLNTLHSHIPAVLSSVLYLQVPEPIVDSDSGGTTFKDPNSVNTRSYSHASFHVAPAPLRLVVFPAWLEHLPERPRPGLLLDVPRIIVSTDLRVNLT